mgnify:CR=1|jgi:hypothetical protein|tara:strand:- start:466 stop:696 length:231 start_codon:yes stop_codon:yes gene_type:complete
MVETRSNDNMRDSENAPRSHTAPPPKKGLFFRVYKPFAHRGETKEQHLARIRRQQIEYNKTFAQRQKKKAITVTFK